MEKTEVLNILNLSAGHNGKPILKDLNLALKKGELVCLMGPNGCGKSTLLHTLAQIIPGLSGTIDCAFEGPREKSMAVVLTDKSFHPDLTGLEMVAMGRYPHLNWLMKMGEEDLEIIESVIERTGIGHLKSLRNQRMSDGQRQMVMIARALVQNTPILLLDEPTSHLDLNNRVEIMNLLRSLARKENKAVLMATHELDLALQTADRVWLANRKGKIKTGVPEDLVLDGSIDEVFSLKGFTLKTGKVDHQFEGGKKVQLKGEAYSYLWTKNALERSGIEVAESAETIIEVEEVDGKISWKLEEKIFGRIEELLETLSYAPIK